MEKFPDNWREFAAGYLDGSGLAAVTGRVERERCGGMEIYPPEGKIFTALEMTPPEKVRVVIVGQDPYHDPGQAHGLAFSVPDGVKIPPSLRNIFREYADDLHREAPGSGTLTRWAEGGVLLLNTVLTVRAGTPGSHAGIGWETVTDALIAAVAARSPRPAVFLLWGKRAAAKRSIVEKNDKNGRHSVIISAHPSPLSATRGFFGSRPFSRAEQFLGGWRWPELK